MATVGSRARPIEVADDSDDDYESAAKRSRRRGDGSGAAGAGQQVVGYDTDEDDTADWYFGPKNDGDGDVHGLGDGVFDSELPDDLKVFAGGRVTKFAPLTEEEEKEVTDISALIQSGHCATIRRPCFAARIDGESKPHRQAISYGCHVAWHLSPRPRHVVVICDADYKPHWIRSNIHIQGEGGEVLDHSEFVGSDAKLVKKLTQRSELPQALFILQGTWVQVEASLRIVETISRELRVLVLSE